MQLNPVFCIKPLYGIKDGIVGWTACRNVGFKEQIILDLAQLLLFRTCQNNICTLIAEITADFFASRLVSSNNQDVMTGQWTGRNLVVVIVFIGFDHWENIFCGNLCKYRSP